MNRWKLLPAVLLGLCGLTFNLQAATLGLIYDTTTNTELLADVSDLGVITPMGTGETACCSVAGELATHNDTNVFFVGSPTGSVAQSFYVLDSTTGNSAQASIAFPATLKVLALSWDDSNNRLLALTQTIGMTSLQLNSVNTTTAALTPIGAGITDCCAVAVGVDVLDADNQLWYLTAQPISTMQWQLYTIDLSTGGLAMPAAVLTQAPVSLMLDAGLLAIYHDPVLPGERLASVDPASGAFTNIGAGQNGCCFAAQGVSAMLNKTVLQVARPDAVNPFAFFSVNAAGVFTQQADVPATMVVNALLGSLEGPQIAEGGLVTVNIDEDNTPTAFALTLNSTDPNGGGLTWSISTPAAMGTAGVAPPGTGLSQVINYTANADVNGMDSFVVQVIDTNGEFDSIIVNVAINPVNDAPSFAIGPNQMANEDSGVQSVPNWVTAISPGPVNEAGQTVQFLVGNDNAGLFSAAPAVATDGTLTYTPAPNQFGTATVMVQAMDDGGTASGGINTSAVQMATITILPVNDAPSFIAGPDQNVLEEAGLQTVPGWATMLSPGPANESSQALSFVVGNNDNTLFSQQPAVDPTGTLTYTPAVDAVGTAIVSVQIMDDGGVANGGVNISAVQMFNINIGEVNDAPSFTPGPNQNVLEDAGAQAVAWATNIDPGAASEVGQMLTFIVSNNNNALFSVQPAIDASGMLTFTSAADEVGNALVDVQLMDDGGTANGGMDTSAVIQFTIDVAEVNDAPSFTAGPNQTVLEDAGLQTVPAWATNISPGPASENSRVLTFNVSNDNNALFSQQPAVDGVTGTLTFTPAVDAVGIAIVDVALMDDGGTANGGVDTSPVQQFTIEITEVNDAPTFTPGPDQNVLEDAGAQAVAWATNIDPGAASEVGQILTFIVSNNNNALFTVQPAIDAGGMLTFTSAPDQVGTAVVDVQLMDDGGTADGGVDISAVIQFNINVAEVNDVPSFTAGPNQALLKDLGPQTVVGWATNLSPGPASEAGQMLSFVVSNNNNPLFSQQPSIDPSGTLTFTSAPDANGIATVDVAIMDDGGTANGGVDTSAVQQFTIDIAAVNDAPSFMVGPDVFAFDEDPAQMISPWATTISAGPPDENGQALTFNVVGNTDPSLFAVQPAVAPDGSLSFTPMLGGDGDSIITLELMDDGGTANGGVDTSPTQNFTITIGPAIADLELTLTAVNAPLVIHPFVSFDIVMQVINSGPQPATGVSTEVTLSSQLAFTGAQAGCADLVGGLVIWDLGALGNNGASASCAFTVQVTGLGALTAVGTTTSDQLDPDPVNNTDITLIQVLESVALEVPTLSRWSLLLLILLLAGLSVRHGEMRKAVRR